MSVTSPQVPPPQRIVIRAHKDPFTVASVEKTIKRNLIGNNIGNLVFSQASFRLLSSQGTSVRRYRGEPAWWLNMTADAFVIPLANAFRPAFIEPLNTLSNVIEKLTIPVVVLGVGAQSGRDHHLEVRDAARRFVAAVLEHSAVIGVRGQYTHDYIKELGFGASNIEIIGCPSMFMHGNHLPVRKKIASIETDTPLALTLSPYRKRMADIANANVAMYPNLTYFAQDMDTLEVMRGGTFEGKAVGKDMPVSRNHPLLANNQTVFPLDPATWMKALSTRDFTFGSRIHGTITSIIAGTPALLLAHDSRTTELADYHRIPYLDLTQLSENVLAHELYEHVDLDPMLNAHQENFDRMNTFITRNGLQAASDQDTIAFDAHIAAIDYPPLVRVQS